MKKILFSFPLLFISLPLYAAIPIDLSQKSSGILAQKTMANATTKLDQEISRSVDAKQTLHIRTQETYKGYKVLGADAVLHIPQVGTSKKAIVNMLSSITSMNGIVYQGLDNDLNKSPTNIFTAEQKERALNSVLTKYQKNSITDVQSELVVYVDDHNKAHWAYQVSFLVPGSQKNKTEKPAFIIDATNFAVYEQWNDLKTFDDVKGGGFGGNHKVGQKFFDGLNGHASPLAMQRDATNNLCYLSNANVKLIDERNDKPIKFTCLNVDPEHNNIYWNANFDQVETTWSPSNDVLYGAQVARDMYQAWYQIPVLVDQNNKPLLLKAYVHLEDENAYWDNNSVSFGDSLGSDLFNPFTQLDTVVHEVSHGFTEQHSDLVYYGQSGGMNESFSDIAGIAAEYFAYGHTDFLVGLGDMKKEGAALRYMDQPSKDGRSIDKVSQYRSGMNPHYSSGILNRVYYLLAHAQGWDPKKAFDVMVEANRHYWTSTSTFDQAGCGILKAADVYNYDKSAINEVFKVVEIDTKGCV